MFQLPTKKILLEASLTDNQFNSAKESLEKANKVKFCDGWIYVINALKNNRYTNSPDNQKAYEREVSLLPDKVRAYFNTTVDTSVDTTVGVLPTVPINHKQEIINKKPERNSIQEVYDYYIERTSSKEGLSPARREKISSRLKDFGLDGCKLAIDGVFSDGFYQGENDRGWKADLDYIFRTYEITERLINKAKPQERRAYDKLEEATRARMARN